MSGIAPFSSERELITFARKFLHGRVQLLNKDVEVCLTANRQVSHAYFPALMTCISFLDLLSGLHAGQLKGQGIEELVAYAAKFMTRTHYPELELTICYEMMRHKIAHLGHPYVVFDTHSSKKLKQSPPKRVTWTLYATNRPLPLELVACPGSSLQYTLRPWEVPYDHRLHISIHRFKVDAVNSINGPTGYRAHLISDPGAKARFAGCMKEYYPP